MPEPDEENDDEKKEVSLEIPEKTRDEWDKYVEESLEYDNRSDMIRTAVAREMKIGRGELELRKPGTGGTADIDVENIDIETDEINDRLTDIEDTLEEVTDILHQQQRESPTEDIQHLMVLIKPLLPLVESREQLLNMTPHSNNLPPSELAQITGTPDAVTAALREDEDPGRENSDQSTDWEVSKVNVEKALARLEDSYGTIHSTVQDGDRRYYQISQ